MRHQPAGGETLNVSEQKCALPAESCSAGQRTHRICMLSCPRVASVGTWARCLHAGEQTYGQAQACRVTAAQRPRGVPSAVKRGSALYLDVVPIHHWTQQRVVDLAPPD